MLGCYVRVSPDELKAVIDDPSGIDDLIFPDEEDDEEPQGAFDLDKAWHLIHFLLTGESWGGKGPIAQAVLGGTSIADTDSGYGPFRYLLAEQVVETAQALAGVSAQSLWARFDAASAAAAGIYPQDAWEGSDTDREYILGNYETLCHCFSEAAASGEAMLLYIA
jgi:hypothetical protein